MKHHHQRTRQTASRYSPTALLIAALSSSMGLSYAYVSTPVFRKNAFLSTKPTRCSHQFAPRSKAETPSFRQRLSMIYAPPGSGYAGPEDEEFPFAETYEPMMEYPGTMRPGRVPENQPFHDLPIGDDDPDPVPWPHFQQIEWHHRWDPPHEHPIPMEEFIQLNGRWASPEMEAAMRAGARRDVRERREQAEAEKQATLIMDDEEDEEGAGDEPVELGDGVFGQLGSIAEDAITAAVVAPPAEDTDQEEETEEEEDSFDDFLLDLGLDADLGDNDDGDEGDDDSSSLDLGLDDENEGVTAETSLEAGDEISLDDDDDDVDMGGDDPFTMVPLEDFGDENDSGLDGEDSPFDDGGFDYDDGDLDLDGGDVW